MGKMGKFAVGTMLAAAAGYVAGILTAPKSGKETREDLKEAAGRSITEAEKQLKHLHTELNTLLEEVAAKAEVATGKAKAELESALQKAKVAKEKARELLSALHEGNAEDAELQKAISEAEKAVEHLKKFLVS